MFLCSSKSWTIIKFKVNRPVGETNNIQHICNRQCSLFPHTQVHLAIKTSQFTWLDLLCVTSAKQVNKQRILKENINKIGMY